MKAGIRNDDLYGGEGTDIFVFHNVFSYSVGIGRNIIHDFELGETIKLSGEHMPSNLADVKKIATQVGGDTVLTIESNDVITIRNFELGNLSDDMFGFM